METIISRLLAQEIPELVEKRGEDLYNIYKSCPQIIENISFLDVYCQYNKHLKSEKDIVTFMVAMYIKNLIEELFPKRK